MLGWADADASAVVEVVLAVDVEARSASIESLLLPLLPLLPLEDVLLVDVSC